MFRELLGKEIYNCNRYISLYLGKISLTKCLNSNKIGVNIICKVPDRP